MTIGFGAAMGHICSPGAINDARGWMWSAEHGARIGTLVIGLAHGCDSCGSDASRTG